MVFQFAVLAGQARFILAENTGCFFLEPVWIGTEMDVFTQCLKGLDLIPEEYRDEILKTILKHYTKLALLTHEGRKFPFAVARCKKLARDHQLFSSVALCDTRSSLPGRATSPPPVSSGAPTDKKSLHIVF